MNKIAHEEGYTIPEVLYAIAIISMAFILVSGIAYSSSILSARTKKTILDNADLIKIDEILRREFSLIIIPYWENEFEALIHEHAIELPFYQGERERKLKLHNASGIYMLEVPGRSTIELGVHFAIENIQLIVNREGKPIGVDMYYQYQGVPGHLATAFSSLPIESGSEL